MYTLKCLSRLNDDDDDGDDDDDYVLLLIFLQTNLRIKVIYLLIHLFINLSIYHLSIYSIFLTSQIPYFW